MRPYTELPGLDEIVLEESYVLYVEATPGQLLFSMDFLLTHKHPEYHAPGPGPYRCYRRGTLLFSGVSRLLWEDQGHKPSRDATGELDHGNIHHMAFDGRRYEFGGDVGQFSILADQIDVVLLPDTPA